MGTDQRDTIAGSNAAKAISGGKGRDQLTGGGGPDAFIFEASGEFGRRRAEIITDFDPNEGDRLAISQDVFVGVPRIKFKAVTGKKEARQAGRSKKNFVYNTKKGWLYYDANGKKDGWGDGGEFARLLGAPELGKKDFIIA